MHRFFVYTNRAKPGLHVWREGTSIRSSLHPVPGSVGPGWVEFHCRLNASIDQPVRFMLFSFQADGSPGDFEDNVFQREMPRLASNEFPKEVWFCSGSSRVLLTDPRLKAQANLRVHLISKARFRPAEMLLWDAVNGASRRVQQSGLDDLGPVFDLSLAAHEQSFFHFKFIGMENGHFASYEPDVANRVWTADDGAEIWLHSSVALIAREVPKTCTLTVNYLQSFSSPAVLHVWTLNGEYQTDVVGIVGPDGWIQFKTAIYSQLGYGCLVRNPGYRDEWEDAEAKRVGIKVTQDTEYWTLEGDSELFDARPIANRQLRLSIANTSLSNLQGSLFAHVWVNRARGPFVTNVPVDANGEIDLDVYPKVTMSIKFYDANGHWEQNRHTVTLDADSPPLQRYVVLERPPFLLSKPPADLVMDPPFQIRRPGANAEAGEMRFVLHTPHAANVELIGEWTDWLSHPVQMHITRDGTYWWCSIKIADIQAGFADGRTDYHGMKYQFLFNQVQRLQDPAAGWVENSSTSSFSLLVNHERFDWQNQRWDRPSPDYYIIYQLHPSRFTNRYQDEPPLRRIAKEIADNAGYFRELGVTAIQLLPVNEVSSTNSWGYDPAYFYAIENNYCGPDGPDDLKHLVHTCHEHGLAVVLDVVFNHAGGDNILWEVARNSFFDGDTQWGALVNFDHPQCLHFFAQNLVYLANEFRIDAFRLDHTATIVHSAAWDNWSGSVRVLGSGGGWEFLQGLRHAVQSQVGRNCLLMAEHLPNEWSLTNAGGPMDSQWGDDFHDRLVDASRRLFGMSRLADAMQLSHTASDDWYKIVQYPESHDEVGNVPDRIANVAGYGQGWRMSKVAAAATLLSRGLPLYFMGAESGEHRQFAFGKADTLDLNEYLANPDRGRIRAWWRELGRLRQDPSIKGPSPLRVTYTSDQIIVFTRGQRDDYVVVLNFGGWSGRIGMSELNVAFGEYRELWNSTWPAFAIQAEQEGEHTNGGRDARLMRDDWINVPDYGVVVLQHR